MIVAALGNIKTYRVTKFGESEWHLQNMATIQKNIALQN